MDIGEEVGENLPPLAGGGGGNNVTRDDVYNRLIENGNEEAIRNPNFRAELEAHFNRLPRSYILDISLDRVEKVLIHKKLLARARDHDNGLALHINFLENVTIKIPSDSTSTAPNKFRASLFPIHEIIFSTVEKPKLLSQLSALLPDVGLTIREAHVFSTKDGYSLVVYLAKGWHSEDTRGLYDLIRKPFAEKEEPWSETQLILDEAIAAERTSDDWEIDLSLLAFGERVSVGSSADLYRGVYLGQDVAIKVLRLDKSNRSAAFAKEVAVLRQAQHENVVRFIGAYMKLPNLYLVTEYMSGGSLWDYLEKNHLALKLPQLLKFAIDICKGMEFLHQNNLIHRDLKTPNLLIDASNVVKVADFGLARFQKNDEKLTGETGTYRWMAPEVMTHKLYNHKADVYSFAIVLWELLTIKIPYGSMTSLQAAREVIEGHRPELPANAHPELLSLMQRCWDSNPDNRPSFTRIRIELEALLVEENGTQGASSSGS